MSGGFYRDGRWVDTSETPWGESYGGAPATSVSAPTPDRLHALQDAVARIIDRFQPEPVDPEMSAIEYLDAKVAELLRRVSAPTPCAGCDSLRLELAASEHNRLAGNAELIQARDTARAALREAEQRYEGASLQRDQANAHARQCRAAAEAAEARCAELEQQIAREHQLIGDHWRTALAEIVLPASPDTERAREEGA